MKIIGHRGAIGYAPENSLKSFEEAIKQKVDYIELDVRLTKDNRLIVVHDPDLSRLFGIPDLIANYNAGDLKKLIPFHGHKVCTLDEALTYINRRTKVNIELKDIGSAKALVAPLRDAKKNGWRDDDFLISSFKAPELEAAKDLFPDVPRGLLRQFWPFVTRGTISQTGMTCLGLHRAIAKRLSVSHAIRQGLTVYVWVEKDERRHKKYEKLGISMIVSDI